ncbi:HU family DNA-binding protein [Croceimicrobium sp.]|uniref:HU family DNA-binding protein n=1 Tax=Croceimicrobium sp. TaxID=2828340 RepID=UPI003BAC7224
MSVQFKVIQRKNPQDFSAAPLHYALAVRGQKVDLDGLSALISDGSTVRQNDVYAVLIGMVNAIIHELQNGRVVQLGKLGSFAISISAEGRQSDEEVTAATIKKSRILYRPQKELQDMLKTLKFERQSSAASS